MKYIALDFETSGIDPKRHFPVSLGVALMDGDQVLADREWLIAPPMKNDRVIREYDVFALQVSGITLKELRNAPTAKQVLSELSDWVASAGASDLAVVAFNAPFDFAFYSELLFSAGDWGSIKGQWLPFPSPLVGPWQCALLMARRELHGLRDYRLDTVAGHFGLTRSTDRHGALEDAILAGRVYASMMPTYAAARGAN